MKYYDDIHNSAIKKLSSYIEPWFFQETPPYQAVVKTILENANNAMDYNDRLRVILLQLQEKTQPDVCPKLDEILKGIYGDLLQVSREGRTVRSYSNRGNSWLKTINVLPVVTLLENPNFLEALPRNIALLDILYYCPKVFVHVLAITQAFPLEQQEETCLPPSAHADHAALVTTLTDYPQHLSQFLNKLRQFSLKQQETFLLKTDKHGRTFLMTILINYPQCLNACLEMLRGFTLAQQKKVFLQTDDRGCNILMLSVSVSVSKFRRKNMIRQHVQDLLAMISTFHPQSQIAIFKQRDTNNRNDKDFMSEDAFMMAIRCNPELVPILWATIKRFSVTARLDILMPSPSSKTNPWQMALISPVDCAMTLIRSKENFAESLTLSYREPTSKYQYYKNALTLAEIYPESCAKILPLLKQIYQQHGLQPLLDKIMAYSDRELSDDEKNFISQGVYDIIKCVPIEISGTLTSVTVTLQGVWRQLEKLIALYQEDDYTFSKKYTRERYHQVKIIYKDLNYFDFLLFFHQYTLAQSRSVMVEENIASSENVATPSQSSLGHDSNVASSSAQVRASSCQMSFYSHLPKEKALNQDATSSSHDTLRSQSHLVEEDNELLCCPITHDRMTDPVVLVDAKGVDGYTYERAAIEAHLKNKLTSPMTNTVLMLPYQLVPNRVVKDLITQQEQREKKGKQKVLG